jgi:hypothetical protein
VVLVVAGGATYALTRSEGQTTVGELSSNPAAQGRPLPISVFNATQVPGAAHQVATTLAGDHLRISTVGNIGTTNTLGPGTFVLYPPHAQAQARHVAALLPEGHATVAPITAQVQSEIGRHAQIVVVLD